MSESLDNISRRVFLETSATLAATVAIPFSVLPKKDRKIGVQLYSVRDDMSKNPDTTLRGLSEEGYKFVECFSDFGQKRGYAYGKVFGKSISEFNALLKNHGLTMPSGHINLGSKHYDAKKNDVTDDWKKIVEDALKLNQHYLIASSWEPADRKTPDDAKKFCDLLNKAGKYCKSQNLKFGYHNHEFEFNELGNEILYDILLSNTDATLVTQEMDLGWVVSANQNPVDWFKKYPGRFELVHFKDNDKSDHTKSTIIGRGKADFPAIIENFKIGGVQHVIVELEDYEKSPLEDLKICCDNTRKLLKKFG